MNTFSKAQHNCVLRMLENMVRVEGGTFMMGSEEGGYGDETPVHVEEVRDFYINKFLTTQEEWEIIVGENPSHFKGDSQRPVECVSFDDIEEKFLPKLNAILKELGLEEYEFCLPTEAEWEFAAKGGNLSKGYVYAGSNNIDEVAWYSNNSGNTTHRVGLLLSNELGIHDMSGNTFEWTCTEHESYTLKIQKREALKIKYPTRQFPQEANLLTWKIAA